MEQTGDADAYFHESKGFDIFQPHENFLNVHNYFYPLFLSGIKIIGIESRQEIAIFQWLCMVAFSIILAGLTYKNIAFGQKALITFFVFLFIFFPNSLSYNPTTNNENLVYLLYLTLMVLIISYVDFIKENTRLHTHNLIQVFFGLSFGIISGLIWMTRPSLVTIPILTLLTINLLILKNKKLIDFVLLNLSYGFSVFLTSIPEIMITRFYSADFANGIFSWDIAKSSPGYSNYIWSGTTNMTSCGPRWMEFSSLGKAHGELASVNLLPDLNIIEKYQSYFFHFISYIDPRPSPTYTFDLVGNKWLVVTFINSLTLALFIFLIYKLIFNLRKHKIMPRLLESILLVWILVIFLTSIRMHGEYRYGQLLFLTIPIYNLFYSHKYFKDKKIKKYVLYILFLTLTIFAGVVFIKNFILHSSAPWVNCVSLG
jgi:hypothetical protein